MCVLILILYKIKYLQFVLLSFVRVVFFRKFHTCIQCILITPILPSVILFSQSPNISPISLPILCLLKKSTYSSIKSIVMPDESSFFPCVCVWYMHTLEASHTPRSQKRVPDTLLYHSDALEAGCH